MRYALPIAAKFNAKITLLHIVEYIPLMPIHGISEPPEVLNGLIEDGERRLEEIARQFGHKNLDNTIVKTGNPSDAIAHYANEWNFDLIILTTHGATGMRHLFMGSTSERVVRHAHCPVLVVHSRHLSEDEGEAPTADLYGHPI
jgi:nucleotide-binding universal stress UspA family protein